MGLVWILSAQDQDLKEAHAQLNKCGQDEFVHQSGQTHVYIEKTIEKKHSGMQKPVKICYMSDISCLHYADRLKAAFILICC